MSADPKPVGVPLPKAPCADTATQCRALGLQVGDTIEGRESAGNHYWHEARLTLLWLGQSVAVWSVTERSSPRCIEWSAPEENADWTLECRRWFKLPTTPQPD